ncbi:MAG: (2Fe-2S) ferredoxin domain-containing protein [Oculatellaceae cyanobacterium Prado106]|jgi:(2Fe-2S) ferredoxin|nr:(2Fe-2S) ferredoxin domain-containing protein [Oculatellaceae cyanobacterium Prado106]
MSHQPLDFNFEGRFLGFTDESGKLKYFRLGLSNEDLQIKLPKKLRESGFSVKIGETIKVTGKGKFNPNTGELKLKASQVFLAPVAPVSNPVQKIIETTLHDNVQSIVQEFTPEPLQSLEPCKAKHEGCPKQKRIQLCHKSGCQKRGGKRLIQALNQLICDRNLQEKISVEYTGCLKRCSAAPNMLIDKKHYSKLNPEELPKVLAKHFEIN